MSFKTPKGTELKLISLKGKPYLPVAERILWFREEHPDWAIHTEIFRLPDNNACLAKAWIKDADDRIVGMAHKLEDAKGFADFIEKSETGAIGRALALCGFGTQFTSEEFDEKDRLADSPRMGFDEPQSTVSAPTRSVGNAEYPKCEVCGKKMLPSKFETGPRFYCPDKKNHKPIQDDLPF